MPLLISLISSILTEAPTLSDSEITKAIESRTNGSSVTTEEKAKAFMTNLSQSKDTSELPTQFKWEETPFGIKYPDLTLSDLSFEDSTLFFFPEGNILLFNFTSRSDIKNDRSLNDLIRDGPQVCQSPIFMKYFIKIHPSYDFDMSVSKIDTFVSELKETLPPEYIEIYNEYKKIIATLESAVKDKSDRMQKIYDSGSELISIIENKSKTTPLTIPYGVIDQRDREITLIGRSYELSNNRHLSVPVMEYNIQQGAFKRTILSKTGSESPSDTKSDSSMSKIILWSSVGVIGLAVVVGVTLLILKSRGPQFNHTP